MRRGGAWSARMTGRPSPRTRCALVMLWCNPVGLLGAHKVYVGQYVEAVFYFFTLGIFGLGWLGDLLTMWSDLEEYNMKISVDRRDYREQKRLLVAYKYGILGGFLGIHHFYLRRPYWGLLYLCTFGLVGLGWITDLFRMPELVKGCNSGAPASVSLFEAYLLWATPLIGMLGLHHLYLRRYCWATLYFFTLGLFGVGWLMDLVRLPSLVRIAREDELQERLPFAVSQTGSRGAYEAVPVLPAGADSSGSAGTPPHRHDAFPAYDQPPAYDTIVPDLRRADAADAAQRSASVIAAAKGPASEADAREDRPGAAGDADRDKTDADDASAGSASGPSASCPNEVIESAVVPTAPPKT